MKATKIINILLDNISYFCNLNRKHFIILITTFYINMIVIIRYFTSIIFLILCQFYVQLYISFT